jgi:hypothetical protein
VPNAHAHVHLGIDSQVGCENGFRIPSQDRRAYLRTWATKFTPQLRLNADKHWRSYLQGWKFAGLVTDPELGAYAARLILKLVKVGGGGEPRALGTNLIGNNLKLQLAEMDALVVRDGGGIAAALVKDGLFNSAARKAEWVTLCDPVARAVPAAVFWSRGTLPQLCPWFESRFFGRHRTNYPLECTFSEYGQHVESAQAMELKEAVVRLTKMLRREKDARRAPEMRIAKTSPLAKAKYEAAKASRLAEGKSEELERDADSRKQLVMRGEALLARMTNASIEQGTEQTACPELSMTFAAFYDCTRRVSRRGPLLPSKRQSCWPPR